MDFKPYWIFPQDGDPLPVIGSGLRHVYINFGSKWVRIRPTPDAPQSVRIPVKKFKGFVPFIEDRGQPLAAVLEALHPTDWRHDGRCRNGECPT